MKRQSEPLQQPQPLNAAKSAPDSKATSEELNNQFRINSKYISLI